MREVFCWLPSTSPDFLDLYPVTYVTAFHLHLEVLEFIDVKGRFWSCGADVLHFEVMGKEMCTTTFGGAKDASDEHKRVPFALPAASINCTLVCGIVPRLPPTSFSVISNKMQLCCLVLVWTVWQEDRAVSQARALVYVQRQDGIVGLSAFPKTFQSNLFLTLSQETLLSCCSTSEESVRQLLWVFLSLSALRKPEVLPFTPSRL